MKEDAVALENGVLCSAFSEIMAFDSKNHIHRSNVRP